MKMLLFTALSLVGPSIVAAILLQASPFPALLLSLTDTNRRVSEWLAVISFLWTTFITVPVPIFLCAVYQSTRDAQQRLNDGLTTRYITKRTFVPWNHDLEK